MEYINYILAVLVIGMVCLVAIRVVSRRSSSGAVARYKASRKALEDAKRQARAPQFKRASKGAVPGQAIPTTPTLQREILQVRTPWGWPNHQAGKASQPGLSGAMQNFTDRLVREKKLAHSNVDTDRMRNSVRALLEDRYGRVHRAQPGSIKYQKVKKPLLRDPSEPHDQMDNFGSAEADRIRQKLRHVKSMGESRSGGSSSGNSARYVEIKDIKQPWGW